jgi:hypothetical protein
VLLLARTLDVESQGVAYFSGVFCTMLTFSGTSSVEAMQANVETFGRVDAIEAECAVFSVDRLVGTRGAERCG